jgi:hypothetical protein
MYVVAYDGSEYAKGALLRAVEYADLTNVEVEAFSVIPDSARYADEQGWVSTREAYELRQIIQELHEQVTTLAPETTFEYETVNGYANAGSIAGRVRNHAIIRMRRSCLSAVNKRAESQPQSAVSANQSHQNKSMTS